MTLIFISISKTGLIIQLMSYIQRAFNMHFVLLLYKIQFTVRPGPRSGSTQTNSYGKKPPYLRKTPFFLGVQKTSRGNMRGNTSR